MNLWNTKDLPEPPINTYKAVNKKIDIKHLYNVFEEATQFFEDNKFMNAEHAVLSRIVYRMKQKFRSAKDFKALEKIDKALQNYFNMDIPRNLKNFMALIPSRYKQVTYLPTKNLLDYILVRLQGSVKLMERIVETCKIAGYLLDKRMHTGHFWKIAFITFSIISRLYILAKYTAKFVCQFYSRLIPFSSQLSNTSEGLPRYEFPTDLKEWMNVDWLEIDDEIQIVEMPSEISDIMQFFDLVNDEDDVQFCDEYYIIKDDDEEETERNLQKISNMNLKNLWELRGFDAKEDVGEVIEINDSVQTLENSGLEKHFDGSNDGNKSSPKQIDSEININKSIQFEDSNIDVDRGVCDYKSQEEKATTFTKKGEEINTITTHDAPLVNSKKKRVKNGLGKFRMEENENQLITSNNSIRFEDSSSDADRDNSNFMSQQGDSKASIITKEDTSSITLPDTPLVDRKENRVKHEIGTYKMEKNSNTFKPDTDTSVIDIDEDTVTSLSVTSISNMTDETLAKIKNRKTKQHKQNNTQTKCYYDTDRNTSNSALQQIHPITFNGTKTSIITIPDTPSADKKEKVTKNDVCKSKIKKNSKFKPDIDFDSDVIEIDEDTVISLPDTFVRGAINETPVRKAERDTKHSKQNGSTNMQASSPFVDSYIDFGRDISRSMLQQTNPITFTLPKVEPSTIIIPDTPVVKKNQKTIKHEAGKLKMEASENKFQPDTDFDRNIIDIDEDTVISLSGTSFRENIDEKPIKPRKWKTKKPKQNESTNTQNSGLLIKNGYNVSTKTKVRWPNQNESKLRPIVRFNEVNGVIKENNKKVKKNNQKWRRHERKELGVDQNYLARPIMSRNDLFIQNKKLPGQATELPNTRKKKWQLKNPVAQVLHLNNAVGEPSTSTFTTNSRKRKMGTEDGSLAVKTLKKAISKNEKNKKMLERKLSQMKHNLKNLSRDLSVDPMRKNITNKMSKSKKRQNNKRLKTGIESNIPQIINQFDSNKTSPSAQQNTTFLMNNSSNVTNKSQLGEFSGGIRESNRKRPHKTGIRKKKKLIGTGSESNIPKIPPNMSRSVWQNRKFLTNNSGNTYLSGDLSGALYPIRQNNRKDTNKMSKSTRKRLQKNKVIRTGTESYNIPTIRPNGTSGLESNKPSNYRQQNTKLIHSPKGNIKKNKRKQRKQNNFWN